MSWITRFAAWTTACGALCLVANGCGSSGPETGRVQGQVQLKGQPLSSGVVSFYAPASGSAATTDVSSDGTFELSTPLPTGAYRVSFLPPPPPETGDPSAKAPPPSVEIPQEYQTESTTPVEVTVESGVNKFSLAIE